MKLRSLLLPALALVGASAHAALIVNGDFESDAYPTGGFSQLNAGPSSLTGWTVLGQEVAGIGKNYPVSNNASQQIDLSGAHDAAGDGIAQSFTTTVGAMYTLSLDVFAGPGTGYDGGVDVYLGAAAYTMGDVAFASNVQGVNATETYTFTATGTTTALSLLSNHGNVSHIDNVSVTPQAVPEPASMAALGLGAVGLLRRRRKA